MAGTRANTTRTTRCCRKPMARSRTCAANLSDSKTTVNERDDLLKNFATCPDSQRAWLALEDYFERLSLSRRDFPATDWWPQMLAVQGKARLEELAFLFLRAKRSVPPELQPHASLDRFARAEEAEQESRLVQELENWLSPPAALHLDTPRATLRVVCKPQPDERGAARHRLAVQFLLSRPRTGEKARSLRDLVELVVRAAHEQELFPPADWEFIHWIYETHRDRADGADTLVLSDAELLQWLARWGHTDRLESAGNGKPLHFHGHMVALTPHLENGDKELVIHASNHIAGRTKTIPSPTRNFSTASRRSRWSATRFICCATRRRPACWNIWPANRPCPCAS